jgi:hypothetical protein
MECGAGGIYLAIETDPQSSRIRYINMHDFNMCGELGIDPTDESRCDKWREYSDGFEFKGNYKVHVAWPDGKVAMRNFPVSLVAKNNVGTIKIKIRPDRSPIIDRSELD